MARLGGHKLHFAFGEGKRLLMDGAGGTELMRKGVPMERLLAANLERPDLVRKTHHQYLASGADMITANTFGVYPEAEAAPLFRAGVRLATQEAKRITRDAYVWASLTPQTLLSPAFDEFNLSSNWTIPVLIETCVSLKEAVAALHTLNNRKPSFVAVTCYFQADASMPDGTLPDQAFWTLRRAGADIIGANCGDTPESLIEVAHRMRHSYWNGIYHQPFVTKSPLLFQPSAGLPQQCADGSLEYPCGPEEWAEIGMQLFDAGVNIVGGCCGTTPAHIAALAERMRVAGD